MKLIKYSIILTSLFINCLYSASIKNEELSSQDVQALKLIGAMQECLKLSEQTSLNPLQNNNLQQNNIKNQFITYLESYITTFGQLSEKQGGFLQGYKNLYYLGSKNLVDQPITPLEYVVLLNTLEKATKNIHWRNTIHLTLLVNKNGISREQKFTIDEIIIAIRNIPLPSFYSMSNILMTAGAVAAIAGGAYIAYNLATNKDFQLFGYDNPFLAKSTNHTDTTLSANENTLLVHTPDQSLQPDQTLDDTSTDTDATSTPTPNDQSLQPDDSSNDTSTNTDATSTPTLNDQSLRPDQKVDNAIPMQELPESDDTTPVDNLQDSSHTTPTSQVPNESDQPIDDSDDTSLVQEPQDTNWLLKHKGKIAMGATALAMATPQGRAQVKKLTTKGKELKARVTKAYQETMPEKKILSKDEQWNNQRVEQQRLQKERVEQERVEQQRLQTERVKQERVEQQRLEEQRLQTELLKNQQLQHEIEKAAIDGRLLQNNNITPQNVLEYAKHRTIDGKRVKMASNHSIHPHISSPAEYEQRLKKVIEEIRETESERAALTEKINNLSEKELFTHTNMPLIKKLENSDNELIKLEEKMSYLSKEYDKSIDINTKHLKNYGYFIQP